MKSLSFPPTDYHCEVWRKVSNFVGPGGGNFLIVGHSRRTAVCHLQSLLDFFKADLRQSPDMASEYSTNLEEVSAIFQYLTRFMLNVRRLRQKTVPLLCRYLPLTFLRCGFFTLRFRCKNVLGLSVINLIHSLERALSTNTML